jgi:hypothetical protein
MNEAISTLGAFRADLRRKPGKEHGLVAEGIDQLPFDGARLEAGSAEAPLTGGLADNARWILGIWYVDHTDPSILVEARSGIGHTMNLGNRMAQVLLAAFLAALMGLTVMTLVAAGVL